MPMIRQRTTMTANGFAQPLANDQLAYLPYPAMCEFAVLADTGASVRSTVYSGTDLLQSSALCDILAVATPIIKDHYTLRDLALAGERLGVELSETAGGTPVVRTQVLITPAR